MLYLCAPALIMEHGMPLVFFIAPATEDTKVDKGHEGKIYIFSKSKARPKTPLFPLCPLSPFVSLIRRRPTIDSTVQATELAKELLRPFVAQLRQDEAP